MNVLRLHDPGRTPASWTDIVQAGQWAVFSKLADSGASCDADGRPFATASDATCLIFDSLDEARRFCLEQVARITSVCFEIFDSAGRTNPPILVIVHPSRESTLFRDPRTLRAWKLAAFGLILAAPLLMWLDYRTVDGAIGLLTFLGLSLIIGGLRLLSYITAIAEAERTREERLARATERAPGVRSPSSDPGGP